MKIKNNLTLKYQITFFVFLFFLALNSISFAATYYMPDDFVNLQNAFDGMDSGDTLIIRDGVYTGTSNMISHAQHPPNGTEGNYTIIKAENTGSVVFDGENARQMFNLFGSSTSYFSYMMFEGLGFKNSSASLASFIYADHIKMMRCFAYDAVGTGQAGDGFSTSGSDHLLFEECWSYGASRKHFYIGKASEKIVLRRCIVRHDRHFDYADQEAFMVYDSKEVEIQNCISIDGDQQAYYTGDTIAAKSFTGRTTIEGFDLEDCYVRGSMSIGNDGMVGALGANENPLNYSNFIHWDSVYGVRIRSANGATFDHATIGNVSGTGTTSPLAYLEYGDPITNSLLYLAYQGIWNAKNSDYNSLYLLTNEYISASAGPNSFCNYNSNAIDPLDGTPGNGITALKYLVRIEEGSDLDGAASDGGDIGATILKKIGVSGTLWGEAGYNNVTSEDLWPFPNEDLIREHMRAYSYDNGNLTGERGFCAGTALDGSPQTLSKYIWEYLGNPIPPEIYGSNPPPPPASDTTPPVISNVGASNITATSATIAWTTNESATSRVDYGETAGYGQQQTQTSLIISPQFVLAGLQPETTYHYQVASADSSGNSTESSGFTFTTQAASSLVTFSTLQDFEDGILWIPGVSQEPTSNGRGWAFLDAGSGAAIAVDSSIGANNTQKSLKVTFDSDNPQLYFRSNDKITDHMPEAAGANRMSFYIRFPDDFPIQALPYRYKTWELGTYIHDPADWYDDTVIMHYYHFLSMEQVGNGWVKYIVTTQPDHEVDQGTIVPDNMPYYFDNFGRFYFHFGTQAGGPLPPRQFTIWIDEIKFYYDDGSVGGQIHVGGQDDVGFDGEFFPDSSDGSPPSAPMGFTVYGVE